MPTASVDIGLASLCEFDEMCVYALQPYRFISCYQLSAAIWERLRTFLVRIAKKKIFCCLNSIFDSVFGTDQ
jgi:hypothetical protein